MRAPYRIAVTHVFGPLNRGDFELFDQLIQILGPNVEVHALARDPERSKSHFPNVRFHPQPGVAPELSGFAAQLVALMRVIILYVAAWLPAAERLLPGPQRDALAAVREADLVIACPGGYLTSTSRSFYPMVAQLEYVVRRSKQAWLAPMSVGPAHGRIHRALLGKALRAASRIYVRESWSQSLCASLGATATLSADLAFRPARDWLEQEVAGPPANSITATVVRWNFPSSPEPERAKDDYHAAMAEMLDWTASQLDLPVKLLLQVDNDRQVTEEVAQRLEADHDIVRVDTPEEYRDILRRSKLMIGSRFHSAVFAMCVGCPTIVVSYLPKATYMMRDMGLSALAHEINDLQAEALKCSYLALNDPSGAMLSRVNNAVVDLTREHANPFISDLRMHLAPVGIALP